MLVANNVQILRWPAQSGFKSYRPLDGPLKMQGSYTAAATKSQEIKRVIPQIVWPF